jgi:hypothetical protein
VIRGEKVINNDVCVSDDKEKKDLVMYYYEVMGDKRLPKILNRLAKGEGFGIENIWCVFAKDFEPWEDEYFGETGVAYYFDYPAVEKDKVVILDYETFYKYLEEVTLGYLERNIEDKENIINLLKVVKEKFVIK